MTAPQQTPLVSGLPATVPFVGPETQERASGKRFQARIGANESAFGPSPNAIAAMQQEALNCWQYCDPENYDLKNELAMKHGLKPENIVVGEGIDGLLGYTARMFVEPGTPVVSSKGAYPTFNFHITGFGGDLSFVDYQDDRENPERLLDAASKTGAKLIYFANPDNPMGTWWSADTVQQFIDQVPDGALLVLDEAYCEFAPDGTLPKLDVSNPNVVRYRTFSKAHGMAGTRIAYAIGEASVIQSFDKIRNHFGVNRIAQAGALAAVRDESWLNSVVRRVSIANQKISDIATQNGLTALPSAANFVAIDCGRDRVFAKAVLNELLNQGIFVRMPGVAPLDRCIRVSAGTENDLQAFAAALPKALDRATAANG
ncbi:MAG: pyridoxal phosphate-dependent aminotransferase [Pseudomonadota bacterium]